MVTLSKLIATTYIRGLEAQVLKDVELALNTMTAYRGTLCSKRTATRMLLSFRGFSKIAIQGRYILMYLTLLCKVLVLSPDAFDMPR